MKTIHRVHLIGAGGVGMSALGLVAHARGFAVTGSDLRESRFTRELSAAGIPVAIGQSTDNIKDGAEKPDVVVVSSAITQVNPELQRACELGIEVWHRSRMLAELGKGLKTIAVAGTHGKTTTSAMLATTLDRLDADPTFLIGGMLDDYPTNALSGKGEYYVIEADESDGSFVHLDPYVAIVTNIEADHLDHYGTIGAIEAAFSNFMRLVPDDGAIVVCGEKRHAVQLARDTGRTVLSYGFGENCDVRCVLDASRGLTSQFEVTMPDGQVATVHLVASPGIHNVLNATSVMAALWFLGYGVEEAAAQLSGFGGVRRRFEPVGEGSGVDVYDDYGHHPTEIKATLAAAASMGYRRIHVLFQPHRYSRTQSLASEFAAAFDDADDVTFIDVYSAGEPPIPGISGKTIVNAVLDRTPRAQVAWMPHRNDVVSYLASKARPGDLVLTLGAGDVTDLGPMLVAELSR